MRWHVSSSCSSDDTRELGTPAQSEFTIIRTETNNGVNSYLSELENTEMKDSKDSLEYNQRNMGTEVGGAGDLPAFPTGQVSSTRR